MEVEKRDSTWQDAYSFTKLEKGDELKPSEFAASKQRIIALRHKVRSVMAGRCKELQSNSSMKQLKVLFNKFNGLGEGYRSENFDGQGEGYSTMPCSTEDMPKKRALLTEGVKNNFMHRREVRKQLQVLQNKLSSLGGIEQEQDWVQPCTVGGVLPFPDQGGFIMTDAPQSGRDFTVCAPNLIEGDELARFEVDTEKTELAREIAAEKAEQERLAAVKAEQERLAAEAE